MTATKEKASTRHRKVGPYRVLGDLGFGGMAQVYKGLHETLQREVAIKELLPHAAKDTDASSRFRREALALAALHHQHIVTVFDLIEKGDTQFLIMELVDGPTLGDLVKQGPLPAQVVAVVAAQLAAALEHAHFHRIVHRDLKPSNVMFTRSGEVKLMDFGIARDEDLGTLTQTGMTVGTPAYMSPEQISGGAVDHRTDLYSLGVVMYECLTSTRPFSGNSPGEVFARVRQAKYTPVGKVGPKVPAALQRMVKKAMQPKPQDRYGDAAQLRRELEAYAAEHSPVSHAALLVSFLSQRGKLSESEVLARLTAQELQSVSIEASSGSLEVGLQAPPRSGWRWLGALLLLAGGGAAGWYYPWWWPSLVAWLGL